MTTEQERRALLKWSKQFNVAASSLPGLKDNVRVGATIRAVIAERDAAWARLTEQDRKEIKDAQASDGDRDDRVSRVQG